MEKFRLRIMVEETVERVDLLVTNEAILASNLLAELRKLLELLTRIRAKFPDAVINDALAYEYLTVKEAVCKAEDVIDELAYQILHLKVTTHFNFLQNLTFNAKFLPKLKILNHSLDDTKRGIGYISFSDSRLVFSYLDQVTDSVVLDSKIGREADASKIVNLLTPSSHQQLLTVVPIVGMAGLGKTGLAKLVCQQVTKLNLFDVKKWVCVSENSDEQQILGRMLQSLNASTGERRLLVLDDVCEDVSRWWDDFKTQLLKICTHNEIVVLVTTRSEQVASIVETSSQHRHTLGLLSDDECWFILKETAFRNVPVQSDLEEIGRAVAIKCKGVPLAAKVLGGIMTFDCWDMNGWLVLEARSNEENVESMLKLGFNLLPSFLKPCFAICSVFPKGFLFIKEDLIHLWMVERFVDSYHMGNRFFYLLLACCFFHDAESDDDGIVIKCKMHNLVHDFALSLEKSRLHIHYLYADHQSIRTSKALPKNKAKYLRTIILNGALFQSSWNSKSLRTLYLNDVDMENFPSPVNKLKHFRYLHVSNTKLSPLHKSITEIYMLQILTLSNCSCEQLPPLGNFPFLKFLKISHMDRVKCIGNESYGDNSSEQHELRLFPALKSLSLSWMENLTDWSPPSHGNRVVIFPRLENLSIQCCAKLTGFPMRDLSALVKVEIKDCEELGFIFDEHKSFPSVTTLSIVGCQKLTDLRNWLLSNKSCKEFRVRRCEWLTFIPNNLGMQRSLTSLQICCCKGVRYFSDDILGKLKQLRKLSIGAFSENLDDFCYLNRIKELTLLKELEIWGSDVFGRKMSVLPNQLKHFYGIRTMKINGFTTMEALPVWLGDHQSLLHISLNYCRHLRHQSTAAILKRLSYLRHVYIRGCHDLEEHKSQLIELLDETATRIFFNGY